MATGGVAWRGRGGASGAVAVETDAVSMATGGAQAQLLRRREVAARERLRWVSARGRVLRLGPGLRDRAGDPELRPLLDAAGSDVSHWFDPQTGDPLQRVEPRSGLVRGVPPGGPPLEPRSDWVPPRDPPWWGDPRLCVGTVTGTPRHLRLRNNLTGDDIVIEVCGEQAGGLLQGALPWNTHILGYAWRCGGVPVSPHLPPPPPDGDDGDGDDGDGDDSPPTVLLYFADDFVEV
ncbi:cytochrome b5 domain-containing protein 1 [Patagioenas fasciata]|uniref:cytochrome b5 domain-containing protein 1 n=1 Tax=Patagioenas fasciata TaxID=372321 RepID=UPI003A99605D